MRSPNEKELTAKESSFERFIELYPRYSALTEKEPTEFRKVYKYLSLPENIWLMIQSVEKGRSALSGVVIELEEKFVGDYDFHDPVKRRIVGAMIREILTDFGYRPGLPQKTKGGDKDLYTKPTSQQVSVPESQFFKTASAYIFYKNFARKKVVASYRVEDL